MVEIVNYIYLKTQKTILEKIIDLNADLGAFIRKIIDQNTDKFAVK